MENMSAQLASVLNACGIVLPLVNLRRKTIKNCDTIWIILQSIERKNPEIKHVGSTAEGLDLTSSDIDFISVVECKVWEHLREATIYKSSGHSFEIVRIPDLAHRGYSKLSVLKCSEGLFDYLVLHGRNHCLKNTINFKTLSKHQKDYPEEVSIHGPALKTRCYPPKDRYSLFREAGNATQINDAISVIEMNTDFVACLRGEQWPVEASEWKTRRRSAKWPSQHLFDNIIKSGYYLAGVGCKESKDNEIQWRVSFNKAEQLIVESLNETQIHCIIILKIFRARLLSGIIGNNITSYTIKTVMFWCLEEKSEKLWQSSTLIFCVCFCISKLKSFVEKRFLPNYFIRERNQFILSELTRNIQIKIVQCLDSFLKDPTASISLILPTYKVYQNTPRVLLNRIRQERLIKNWLRLRVFIAQQYHAPAGCEFWKLYDGYNINKILLRCHEVLEKLKKVSYAQPFVKILQNCMGVLQYVLLMKEKQTFACTKHSINRRKYTNFMELSFAGEVTNTNLRIATCYLDDGVTEDCLKIIQTVTGQTNRFKVNYKQHVIQTLNRAIEGFQNMEPLCKDTEIEMYNRIIRKDLTDQDPYKTIEELEIMKRTGNCVGGYDVFNLIWKQFWFDVTFMPAELPVLPKPAALELCIDNSQKKISFHPFLMGFFLIFSVIRGMVQSNCTKTRL